MVIASSSVHSAMLHPPCPGSRAELTVNVFATAAEAGNETARDAVRATAANRGRRALLSMIASPPWMA